MRRFTIISAVYNVARYLPDFIRSIESQSFAESQLEVIMVDDGSTDGSLDVLRKWESERPDTVTVLSKENGGQSSARNLGLDRATGDWITFIDPDDWVDENYFSTVDDFVTKRADTMMVACNRIFFEESTGEVRNGHPLRKLFTADQLVDLDRRPGYFHGSAPAAFVRRSIIERHALRFDERIRPNFEDGHFCSRYLLRCSEPQVAFLGTARYLYRKRADGSSTLQNSTAQIGRYDEVPRLGYLDLLAEARSERGSIPLWLQYFILYELSWYFSSEEKPNNNVTVAAGEIGARFIKILGEISLQLDDAAIESFEVRKYKHEWRATLRYAVRGLDWHTPYVVLQNIDEARNLVRVAYRFCGPEPPMSITMSGKPVEPWDSKVRSHEYFGQAMVKERSAWVPLNGTLRVEIDGKLVELRTSWEPRRVVSLSRKQIRGTFDPDVGGGFRRRLLDRARSSLGPLRKITPITLVTSVAEMARDGLAPTKWLRASERRVVVQLASTWFVRRRFDGAWVLMDRIHNSNDSAEELFRYLRSQRPEVNAWFTVEAGTDDWKRLREFERKRVIAHGSFTWKLLMLNCANLISSHADVPIHHPPRIVELAPPDWRFVFLQHGVIKDDLSRWLNPKRIDLFVTSTVDEYKSIAASESPYVFSAKEVKLTGLPRFDALERAKRSISSAARPVVLITPTWRYWLNQPLAAGSQRRAVVPDFESTEFAHRWRSIASSERLGSIANKHGCEVVFLPHPNLRAASGMFEQAGNGEVLDFSSPHLHEIFARTVVNITDFSSMAFNVAYLGQPSIYYQFDRELITNGGHVGRAGYFSYDDHGFGPVVFEEDEVFDNLATILDAGGDPGAPYIDRIKQSFPFRDGRCCERVADEIQDLDRKAIGGPSRPSVDAP